MDRLIDRFIEVFFDDERTAGLILRCCTIAAPGLTIILIAAIVGGSPQH